MDLKGQLDQRALRDLKVRMVLLDLRDQRETLV